MLHVVERWEGEHSRAGGWGAEVEGLHVPAEITDTQPRCTRRAVVKRDASTTERDVE